MDPPRANPRLHELQCLSKLALITTSYSFRYVVVIPYRPDMHKPPTFYLLVYPSDRVSEAVSSVKLQKFQAEIWAGDCFGAVSVTS